MYRYTIERNLQETLLLAFAEFSVAVINSINKLNENMENLGRELEIKKIIKNKFCNLKIWELKLRTQ